MSIKLTEMVNVFISVHSLTLFIFRSQRVIDSKESEHKLKLELIELNLIQIKTQQNQHKEYYYSK